MLTLPHRGYLGGRNGGKAAGGTVLDQRGEGEMVKLRRIGGGGGEEERKNCFCQIM